MRRWRHTRYSQITEGRVSPQTGDWCLSCCRGGWWLRLPCFDLDPSLK